MEKEPWQHEHGIHNITVLIKSRICLLPNADEVNNKRIECLNGVNNVSSSIPFHRSIEDKKSVVYMFNERG